MNTTRAFIAIDIPENVQQELSELIASFKKHGSDVKWIDVKNLHATLKFLGNISEIQINTVKKFFEKFSLEEKPFIIRLSSIGGFPDLNRPGTIWAGIDEGSNALLSLAAKIDSELVHYGFARETRPFFAHLTLGRARSEQNLDRLTAILKTIPFKSKFEFEIDHVTLYKSILTSKGPIYEPIESCKLQGL